jgi:hypothetical protein
MLKNISRGGKTGESRLLIKLDGSLATQAYPLGGEGLIAPFLATRAETQSEARHPDFFIVGAPRCGTTAMTHYLAEHPDIFMARKELHFFGRDLSFGKRFYRRSAKAYLREFADWNGQRRAGEGSVWYLASKTAAREIHGFNPCARIIIMLREPSEMLHSLYHMFRYDGNEPLKTFPEALEAEDDRRACRRLGRGTYLAQGLLYREVPRYTQQVKRYFDVFGRDRVHVVLYDDFAKHLQQTYDATLEFLGVSPVPRPNGFKVVNEHRSVKNRVLHAVLRDATLRSMVLRMRGSMPVWLFKALQRAEERVWRTNTRPAQRAPMAPELRSRLKFEFADEVESLSQLLGRDLSHWSR